MNALWRSHVLIITAVGVLTMLSMLKNLSSTRRAIALSHDLHYAGDSSPHTRSSSNLHYRLDDQLETKYSTTHHKIRGSFSQILNDKDETHLHNNDFQHKGILHTSTEKHGKWARIRWMRQDAELIIAGETVHKAGTNYSKYVEDTRLVIDVNDTIVFPSAEQDSVRIPGEPERTMHLCHLLRLVTGRTNLGVERQVGTPPVVLNISADCGKINEQANGQASTILALYRLKMTTALAKVDFRFHCTNHNDNDGKLFPNDYMKEKSRKLRWVFPWFASHQSSSDDTDPWPYRGDAPTEDQLCSIGNSTSDTIIPIETMADHIREDVRKMALQLMGSHSKDPKKIRIHPLIPLDIDPWIPGMDVDDVIIHFPCYSDVSDSTQQKQQNSVGMMQFHEYTKHIHKSVKTIGILREETNEKDDVCYRASNLFLEYLQSFYKDVSISMYDNDSLPLQYARIVMARQSFSSFSEFGMIPIIGTFGEGYFQPLPDNSILPNIVNYKGFENLHLLNGNVLSPKAIDTMSFTDLSNWLVSEP